VEDWERRVEGVFVGPLESEVIEFTVKPLEGARLEEILRQLQSDEPRKKAQALELLRRGRAVDAIPDLFVYLRPEQPEAVRREAARAVMDFPDKEKWQTYAAFLKDPSRDVRVGMAYAMASLKLKEAGDALYEVTDPEKYPESYGSAFRALIQIDDPRVKEVAERLSQTAPSEYIRDWASRVAKGENTKWP
jgi:HEAT repeat protein